MKNKIALLYKCICLNKYIIKEFDKINKEVGGMMEIFLSYDNTKEDFIAPEGAKTHLYSLNSIHEYKESFYDQNEHSPLWYNPEYAILDFYNKNNNFDYIWSVDYDVRFSGSWSYFFNCFMNSDSDLISINIKEIEKDSRYVFRNKIKLLSKYYKKYVAFFAIYRYSREALEYLDKKYKEGNRGFCEVVVPTLLNIGGFKMENISTDMYRLHDTVRYRPVMKSPGKEKNMLYHPVKEWIK